MIAQIANHKGDKIECSYQLKKIGFKKWGYTILMNDRVLIYQDRIPGVTGIKPFSSKNKAKKTALLAIRKINNGQFPPSISIEELEKLKVLP